MLFEYVSIMFSIFFKMFFKINNVPLTVNMFFKLNNLPRHEQVMFPHKNCSLKNVLQVKQKKHYRGTKEIEHLFGEHY